jgi:hypothetical protein
MVDGWLLTAAHTSIISYLLNVHGQAKPPVDACARCTLAGSALGTTLCSVLLRLVVSHGAVRTARRCPA